MLVTTVPSMISDLQAAVYRNSMSQGAAPDSMLLGIQQAGFLASHQSLHNSFRACTRYIRFTQYYGKNRTILHFSLRTDCEGRNLYCRSIHPFHHCTVFRQMAWAARRTGNTDCTFFSCMLGVKKHAAASISRPLSIAF